MKTIFKPVLVIALASIPLFFQGCDKAKDPVKGAYQSGVLIVSEGSFSSNNGDVTYYNSSTSLLEQTIFKNINGSFAGKVLQSITVDGDDGYLVLNGDNKIEVVDINSFKRKNAFTNTKLDKPRYLKVINGKAYISVWGAYDANYALIDSYVMVVDTKTLSVVTTIDTNEGVENLLYDGKLLFVSRNGFSGSNSLSVIDPSNDKIVKEVNLSGEPVAMILDVNNKLWVVTTDGVSKLFRINTTTFDVEQTIEIGSKARGYLAITPDKRSLIYAIGKSVYKMSIDATTAPTTPLFTASDVTAFYGLNVDPKTGDIYIGDAKNYSSAGSAYIFNADGTFKNKVETGIAPNSFVFK
ncbi:MAG: YncE family protein [Cyclobacteriaceae bacterium]